MRVPVAPRPCQHLVLVLWILAILICVWWDLIVLIFISLMTYDEEHLFICLSAILMNFDIISKIHRGKKR